MMPMKKERPGRKPRPITIRTVGTPSSAGLAAVARLLLMREHEKVKLEKVANSGDRTRLSEP